MEKVFVWMLLYIVVVDGYLFVVKLLVEVGVEVDKLDLLGWMVREYVVLRGYMFIVYFFVVQSKEGEDMVSNIFDDEKLVMDNVVVFDKVLFQERWLKGFVCKVELVKLFGYWYFKDESLVLVSLGLMDMWKNFEVVKLDNILFLKVYMMELDIMLLIVVLV